MAAPEATIVSIAGLIKYMAPLSDSSQPHRAASGQLGKLNPFPSKMRRGQGDVKQFAFLDLVPIVSRVAKMTDRRTDSKILVPGY